MVTSISIDAMGGDFGPQVTVPAALSVLDETIDVDFYLVGDQSEIEHQLEKHGPVDRSRLHLVHTTQCVEMDEHPRRAWIKKDSSMRVAISLVREGKVKACVSAGNTGALVMVSKILLKTFPHVHRPAIISALPTMTGHVNMLDLGGIVDCKAEHLFQFGIMGSTFVKYMEGIPNPRVALLNIGKEKYKGNKATSDAGELFRSSTINYQGYIEGDAIFTSDVEVVVCDGFVGNVAIKTSEGVSKFIQQALRKEFEHSIMSKLVGLVAQPIMERVKSRVDPRVFNGAALIGLRGSVIKSHGGADAVAFSYAIRKTLTEISNDVPSKIEHEISSAVGAAV